MSARGLAAGVVLAALLFAGAGHAQEPGGADRATLARLEQRSKSFYDLVERGDRERASGLWPELVDDLRAFAEGIQGRLDAMRDDIVERDGDLDALYQSPRWRDGEVMALVATYHLAWVRYQAAQLVGDAAKKKQLLQKAVEGFSRFLLVNEVPEIYAESLYGRGLAFLDLGDTAKAIDDLNAASNEPRVGPKARAALEVARRRGAGGKTPPENDPEAMLGRLSELLPRAAAGDAGAEKEATTLARGLAARGGTWPARVASLVNEKVGTGGDARSSFGLTLLGQLAVDRGRCADVAPLVKAGADLEDAGRARHRPELLYLDAGCRLNGGDASGAAEGFAALLAAFPGSPRAREAAYYRFRALDVARGADPSLTDAYAQALETYVARWGRAEGGAEAHFLLGELSRARGDCERAAREYAEVAAGPFAARARLGALECRVAGLEAAPAGRPEVLDALRAFVRATPDQTLASRAALLGALVAAGARPADNAAVIELLDGFETRYPEARALHARAREVRLAARVALGQLDTAGRDLEAVLAAGGADAGMLARLGRELATQAERAADPAARAQALSLARRAYGALVALRGDPRDRIALADLDLKAGDAAAARRGYEAVLAADTESAEALRGAARAAAASGDRAAALGYWRRIVEGSPTGGTAWYEARLAQVTLLAEDGHPGEACEVLRLSRGRATSAGADQLEARLRGLEPQVCR